MKEESLQSEFFRNNIVSKGYEEIKRYKKERHQKKMNAYNKTYLQDKKSKSLVFDKESYKRIQELAKEHNLAEASFLKACIWGYIDSFYVTKDAQTIEALEQTLLQSKNAILQCLQFVHQNREITYADIKAITQEIADLNFFIKNTLSNPPRLSVWLRQESSKNPDFIAHLLEAISQYLITK